MKKIISLLLAGIMCISLYSCKAEDGENKESDIEEVSDVEGGDEGSDSETAEGEEEYLDGAWLDSESNTYMNYSDNKVAAKQGNTHYYIVNDSSDDPYKSYIYREDISGEHEREVIECNSSAVYYPIPVGRYVYYFSTSETGSYKHQTRGLYRYDCLTGETKSYSDSELNSVVNKGHSARNYVYYDGYLYVNAEDIDVIYKCDLESGSVEEFYNCSTYICSIFTDGKQLLIEMKNSDTDTLCVYSLDFNTKETKMLVDLNTTMQNEYWVTIEDGGGVIYYIDKDVSDGSAGTPEAYNIETGETTPFFGSKSLEYCGEDIYFMGFSFDKVGNRMYATIRKTDESLVYGYLDFDEKGAAYISEPYDLIYDGKDSPRSELFGLTEIDGYMYYESQEDFHYDIFIMHRITPDGAHELLEYKG